MSEKIVGICVLGLVAICAIFAMGDPAAKEVVIPIISGVAGVITGAALK